MTKRLATLLIAALALGLVAAGCGGDDDETTTSSTTTTTEGTTGASGATGAADVSPERAALIEEADAICKEGDDAIDAAAQEQFGDATQEPSAADQEAFVEDTVVPNIQDQLDQLAELDPPEEDAEEFQGIIDDARTALDEIADDPASYVESAGSDNPFEAVNQRAKAFGLTSCGGD